MSHCNFPAKSANLIPKNVFKWHSVLVWLFLGLMLVFYSFSAESSSFHPSEISLQHDSILSLQSDFKKKNLSPHLLLFEEQSDVPWQYDDALAQMAVLEPLITRDIPSIGFSYQQKYWGLITIKNDDSKPLSTSPLILQFKDALIDQLTLYLVSDQQETKIIELGRLHLENKYYENDRFNSTNISIKPNETLSIVFMVHSSEPYTLMVQLFEKLSYIKSETNSLIMASLYLGVVLCSLFFSVLILSYIREMIYLYHAISSFCINLMCALSMYGGMAILLPPHYLWWQIESVIWFLSVGILFFCLFAIQILQKEKHFDEVKLFLYGIVVSTAITIISLFFLPYEYAVVIENLNASAAATIIFMSALYLYLRGGKEVIYFLLALGTNIVGGLIFSLKHWSILPANEFTMNAWLIGSAIECVLLCLVICRNYLSEKREKSQAKRDALVNEQQALAKEALLNAEKTITLRLEKEVQQKTQQLLHSLYMDSVTNLFNRTKLLQDLLSNSDENIKHLAALSIDDFRETCDFLGPSFGDKVLLLISERLENYFNQPKYVDYKIYRLQFDEFAIAANQNVSSDDFDQVFNSINSGIFGESLMVDGSIFPVFLSIGLSHSYSSTNEEILSSHEHELLTKANMALSEAKTKKNMVVTFSQDLPNLEKIRYNLLWTSKLKEAIEEQRVIVYAQPIVTADTQSYDKYEVLVRLKEKDGSIVSPFYFLPVAYHSNLYPFITRTVVTSACEFFSKFDCDFSINIQLRDIENRETIEFLKAEMIRYDVANRVIIELVESEDFEELGLLQNFITEMRRLGCKIAIDDFGTGYSNFAYISKIHPDIIKIDGSLIKNMDKDKDLLSVVTSICEFSKKLGIRTTAEYIHSESVLKIANGLGIDYLQGFYLGEPKALDQLVVGFDLDNIPHKGHSDLSNPQVGRLN